METGGKGENFGGMRPLLETKKEKGCPLAGAGSGRTSITSSLGESPFLPVGLTLRFKGSPLPALPCWALE